MDDPIETLGRWIEDARRSGAPAPAAMSLASATADGRPSSRLVSLKRLDGDGLIFTTGLWTRKAKELAANAQVAATLFWPAAGRQVRIEGRASIAERSLAEELFAKRPRSHQLQALVSRQGEEIEDLALLRERLAALAVELGDDPIPCPEDWGAIRIAPERIEFWEEAPDRLHDRVLFEVCASGWTRTLLAP